MTIGALAQHRTRWLLHGMLVLSVGFGLAFNVVGPVRFIADQNIQRAIHPELVAPGGKAGLDVYYLASLGDDALSVLAENRCSLPAPFIGEAADLLEFWTDRLADDKPGRAWQAWNLSRERARDVKVPVICFLSAR